MITMHPTIGLSVLESGDEAAYRLWLLIQDETAVNLGVDDTIPIDQPSGRERIETGLGVGWKRIKQIADQGNGRFWDVERDHREFLIGLRPYHLTAVTKHLGLSDIGEPAEIETAVLRSASEFQAAVLAAWRAGRVGSGTELIDVAAIRTDGGTQARAGLDANTVDEYRQLLTDNGFNDAGQPVWPFRDPVVLFYDGSEYWLGDGFHRVEACRRAGRFVIAAEVKAGTRRDAVLFAAGANSSHGLRRTRADVRRAIQLLLDDPEWSQWSDREIARQVHCDHKTVGSMRAAASGEIPQIRTFSRNGKTYEMDTAAIGSSQDDNTSKNKKPIKYAPIWELKSCVMSWVTLKWGEHIPQTIYDFTLPKLAELFDSSAYWHSFHIFLPEHWRKEDVVTAINEVAANLRIREQQEKEKTAVTEQSAEAVNETETVVLPAALAATQTNTPTAMENHEYTIQDVIRAVQSLTAREHMDMLLFCKNMQIDEPERTAALWRSLSAMIDYWWGRK